VRRWQFVSDLPNCRIAVSELPTAVQGGVKSLKGSLRMWERRIFLKTSPPLSLIKAFRMNLISADPSRWTVPLIYLLKLSLN